MHLVNPGERFVLRSESSEAPKVGRLGIFGWMSFDWAAQPFFTIVTTFIFGPYFVSRLAENPAVGQAVWAYALAIGGIAIAVLSPILGSISDQTGPRKPWIAFFAVIQITCMALLWTAAPGSNIYLIAMYFVLATIAAELGVAHKVIKSMKGKFPRSNEATLIRSTPTSFNNSKLGSSNGVDINKTLFLMQSSLSIGSQSFCSSNFSLCSP